jgi:hypothetical protein
VPSGKSPCLTCGLRLDAFIPLNYLKNTKQPQMNADTCR